MDADANELLGLFKLTHNITLEQRACSPTGTL